MAKKTSHKIKKIVKKKNSNRYIQFFLLALVSCLTVFTIGNHFIKQPLPCANTKTCKSDLSVQIDNKAIGSFAGHEIVPPTIDTTQDTKKFAVLGANTATGEKHIYIDLSIQKLYAFQGNDKVLETFIASGKWNPTPVGNFHIWEKLRATRMAGGEGADAYDLPNVPYVMYFFQDYGLHGAYWHNNFGHMMSHGCVNMRIIDAQTLFDWAEIQTPVSVCNTFTEPNNCVQNNPIN